MLMEMNQKQKEQTLTAVSRFKATSRSVDTEYIDRHMSGTRCQEPEYVN